MFRFLAVASTLAVLITLSIPQTLLAHSVSGSEDPSGVIHGTPYTQNITNWQAHVNYYESQRPGHTYIQINRGDGDSLASVGDSHTTYGYGYTNTPEGRKAHHAYHGRDPDNGTGGLSKTVIDAQTVTAFGATRNDGSGQYTPGKTAYYSHEHQKGDYPLGRKRQPPPVIRVTEYIVADWSNGIRELPQWVELYNPNATDINITGYQFYYATFNRERHQYEITDEPVMLKIVIPARDAVILATHKVLNRASRIGGISEEHVFVLNIPNVLKQGWRIVRPNDRVFHEIGRLFTNGAVGDPVQPNHINKSRQAYQRYASESPPDPHYYGLQWDGGSPGFHREVERAAGAPSNPYLRAKRLTTTWGALKDRQ